jgi:hypothetical protein
MSFYNGSLTLWGSFIVSLEVNIVLFIEVNMTFLLIGLFAFVHWTPSGCDCSSVG